MWLPISGYLNKFFLIKPPCKPGDYYKDKIIDLIKKNFFFDLDKNEVEFKWGDVYIKTKNNSIKNEIFIQKNKILKTLEENFKDIKFNEIRFI